MAVQDCTDSIANTMRLLSFSTESSITLQWRHNERDGDSNHRRLDCLFNRFFRHRLKKTLKLIVAGLCEGETTDDRWFPHKGPVARKSFPFEGVPMVAVKTWWHSAKAGVKASFVFVRCKNIASVIMVTRINIFLYIFWRVNTFLHILRQGFYFRRVVYIET